LHDIEEGMGSRILILETDPSALDVAKVALSRDPTVEVVGATSTDTIEQTLKNEAFAAIVVRASMLEGNTLSLLRQGHPTAVRIVVATRSEREAVHQSLSFAHQFLPRPYQNDMLRSAVQRALGLSLVLEHAELRDLLGRLDKLPESAGTYGQINDALKRRGSTSHDVARIVERDPALSAKLLQIVNSAYFGVSRRIVRVGEAVSFLGTELVKSVALCSHVSAMMGDRPRQPGFSIDEEQQRAILVAKLAQSMLTRRDLADLAHTAGLLHGIGRLVLALSGSRHLRSVDHAVIGSHLLGLWGIPEPIVEAVAFHRNPRRSGKRELGVIAAVHIASALVCERMGGTETLDHDYLAAIGCTHRLHDWRRVA
jgi:HD-like signal output (HDOD) protein